MRKHISSPLECGDGAWVPLAKASANEVVVLGAAKNFQTARSPKDLINYGHTGEKHYGFDSFEGLPEGGPNDASWKKGQLAVPLEVARKNLSEFAELCVLIAGWIPDTFTAVSDKRFRLVHVDVDLEVPTRQSLEYFYPRATDGALFIIDDYGFHSCPGARQATQEFLAGRPETLIELTTGQAVFYKRGSACS